MREWVRAHPNYIIGFLAWMAAITLVYFSPYLLKKREPCPDCDDHSKFVSSLTPEQKISYEMYESAAIRVGDGYFLIGEGSDDEYQLYRNGRIRYKEVFPILNEQTRGLTLMNSILKSLPSNERELVLKRKAVIVYRDGHFMMVSDSKEDNN